jgi:hypothetical protein
MLDTRTILIVDRMEIFGLIALLALETQFEDSSN